MLTVNGDLVALFTGFVGQAMNSFVPLLTAVIGLFLAFAIADRVRFSIGKMVKK
jgi:hypothetical protein